MSESLPRALRVRVLMRSMLVQGSWNYETLLGTGFAFALLPMLRRSLDDEEEVSRALARHAELFNSHPYLATLALGAVARLEAERTPEQVTTRFKNALRGSLGALGDQLFWRSWRPFCLAFGLALALAAAPWWLVLGTVFVVYNAGHLWARVWGLRTGYGAGLEVGRVIREAPLPRLGQRIGDLGALAAGIATALAVGLGEAPAEMALLAAAAAAGIVLGGRTRPAAGIVIGAAALLAALLERT